ncbi:hypothetical protein GCM10019017_17850 [Streptomyces showdoensis]
MALGSSGPVRAPPPRLRPRVPAPGPRPSPPAGPGAPHRGGAAQPHGDRAARGVVTGHPVAVLGRLLRPGAGRVVSRRRGRVRGLPAGCPDGVREGLADGGLQQPGGVRRQPLGPDDGLGQVETALGTAGVHRTLLPPTMR